MTGENSLVLRQDDPGVTTLTLNRPQARNALSRAMLRALHRACDDIAADQAVRVVILAGAGPGFCAGHDLKQAMQMLLTGDPIDAATALRFGLVNEIVPAAELAARTAALARQLASKSPLTLAIGKEAFYRQLELPLADAYDYSRQAMVRNLLTLDAQEGIAAFIDKRPPRWCGH